MTSIELTALAASTNLLAGWRAPDVVRAMIGIDGIQVYLLHD